MKQLRKTLFGFDVGTVKRRLRDIKRISELELTQWQEKITNAAKYRSALQAELLAFGHVSPADTAESVAPVEHALAVEEAAVAVEEAAVAVEMFKKSKIVQFRRKIDPPSSSGPNRENSDSLAYSETEGAGFWGSVEAYLAMPVVSEEVLIAQTEFSFALPKLDGTSFSVEYPKYFNYTFTETPIQYGIAPAPGKDRRANDKLPQLPLKKPDKPNEQKKDETAAPRTQRGNEDLSASRGSEEITREVRELRYKYIVGKWAGEDLFNDRGEMIITKNNQITEAVIDEAWREGKLALLIVHMTIPGLGEEE